MHERWLCEYSDLREYCFCVDCLSVFIESRSRTAVSQFDTFDLSFPLPIPPSCSDHFPPLISYSFRTRFPTRFDTFLQWRLRVCRVLHVWCYLFPHDRCFPLWIFSTFLTFVYVPCCACLLSSIYLRWLSFASHLCNVNSRHYATNLTALVCHLYNPISLSPTISKSFPQLKLRLVVVYTRFKDRDPTSFPTSPQDH